MVQRSFLLSPAVLIAFFIILRTVSQILFKHIAKPLPSTIPGNNRSNTAELFAQLGK